VYHGPIRGIRHDHGQSVRGQPVPAEVLLHGESRAQQSHRAPTRAARRGRHHLHEVEHRDAYRGGDLVHGVDAQQMVLVHSSRSAPGRLNLHRHARQPVVLGAAFPAHPAEHPDRQHLCAPLR